MEVGWVILSQTSSLCGDSFVSKIFIKLTLKKIPR